MLFGKNFSNSIINLVFCSHQNYLINILILFGTISDICTENKTQNEISINCIQHSYIDSFCAGF